MSYKHLKKWNGGETGIDSLENYVAPRSRRQGPGYFYRACSVDCAKRRLNSSEGICDRVHAVAALVAENKVRRPRVRLLAALEKFLKSKDVGDSGKLAAALRATGDPDLLRYASLYDKSEDA